MKNYFKNSKAITLIALIITIVILIILAGVVISLSLENNGLFNKAKDAKEEYLNAQNYEDTEIAKVSNQIESWTNIEEDENDVLKNWDKIYTLNEGGIWKKVDSNIANKVIVAQVVNPENMEQKLYIVDYNAIPIYGSSYFTMGYTISEPKRSINVAKSTTNDELWVSTYDLTNDIVNFYVKDINQLNFGEKIYTLDEGGIWKYINYDVSENKIIKIVVYNSEKTESSTYYVSSNTLSRGGYGTLGTSITEPIRALNIGANAENDKFYVSFYSDTTDTADVYIYGF